MARRDEQGNQPLARGTDPSLRAKEDDLHRHVRRLFHKIKKTFKFAYSVSTGDMVSVLVLRWVKTRRGKPRSEWERLLHLTGEKRVMGTSVKNVLIDELRRQREKEKKKEQDGPLQEVLVTAVEAMSEGQVVESIELARMCDWCEAQIVQLEAGEWDSGVRALHRPPDVCLLGAVLRAAIEGKDAKASAKQHGIGEDRVGELLDKGYRYLALLRHLSEQD